MLGALLALTTLLGGVFAGTLGVVLALGTTLGLLLVSPNLPIGWLLRGQGASRLSRAAAPDLHAIVDTLARRAGLSSAPRLFLTPSPQPNAFTVGQGHEAVIVVSAGLLRLLDRRELTGVLAHEIAHVVHEDTRTLRVAATMNTVLGWLARAGWWMAIFSLPLVLLGSLDLPVFGLLLLLVGPWVGQALQLSLSRAREFAADDAAVRLTGDPEGLAQALLRLESGQRGLLSVLLGMGATRAPEWLRTHPATPRRVERLVGRQPVAAPPRVHARQTPARPRTLVAGRRPVLIRTVRLGAR